MGTLLIILLLLIIVLLYTLNYYIDKRSALSQDLLRIYGELELSIANERNLDNSTIEFLKAYKFVALNPRLLDVIILEFIHAADKKGVHKMNHDFKKIELSLSESSRKLLNQYHQVSNELLKLSMIKPVSVWWYLKELASYCWRAVFTLHSPLKLVKKAYRELQSEKYAIAYFGYRNMIQTA